MARSAPTLLVSEMFVSLQGEGISMGQPAAFLRLAACNLACSFCDTPYTWDFRRFDRAREVKESSVAEVADWAIRHAPGRLIVTGGEPLLQIAALEELLAALDAELAERRLMPLTIEVETNGTVVPSAALALRVDQWNVSPKLGNSGEPWGRRHKLDALRFFSLSERAWFKFVVESESDAGEALELCDELSVPRSRTLFMPQAQNAGELRERAPVVAAWALEARVRFSGRVHLELWGGRRGT